MCRFHSYGHKCSGFWKLAGYPCDAATISTASESLNSFLQNFSGMSVYMKQETFMVFTVMLTAIHNWMISETQKLYLQK